MSERPTAIAVGPDDGLDDVLGRLRDAAGHPVLLAIPDDSALFLTASEFRALKEVADRGRVAVSVRSGDPLRLQLARLLGIDAAPAASAPRPAPAVAQATAPAKPAPPKTAAPAAVRPAPAPAAAKTPAPAPVKTASTTEPPAAAPARPTGEQAQGAPRPRSGPPKADGPAAPPAMPSVPPAQGAEPPPPTPALVATPPIAAADAVETPGASASPPASDAETGWPEPPPPVPPPARRRPGPSVQRLSLGGALRALPGRRPRGTRPTGVGSPATEAATAATTASPSAQPGAAQVGRNGVGSAVPEHAVELAAADSREVGTDEERSGGVGHLGPWRAGVERLRASPRVLAAVVGAVILVLALASVLTVVVLPRAEVTLVLAQRPLTAELLYDVAADGARLPGRADLAAAAEPVSVEIVYNGSIPTTGVRRVPDGTASGTVRLRNVEAEALTVEQGTVLTTEEGVEYAVAADVEVPAADGERPGEAKGEVRAVEAGSGGNAETPGVLSGRLPNGVYFSSRDGPLAGGSDREVRVVAEEDLATLREAAAAAAPELAAEALAAERGRETAVLAFSVELGEGRDEFDHRVGDEAERLSLRAARPVTALAYDPAGIRDEARETLARRLVAEVPAGYELDPASITIASPVAVEETAEGARFRLRASAQARATLDEAALAERLAGADPRQAAATLGDWPQVREFRVAYHPSWLPLPDRMPSSPDRIDIQVASEPARAAAAASPEAIPAAEATP